MIKTYLFEELPAPDIELDLEYTYSFTPGKYDGLPENCYPEEEDSELAPPNGYEQIVINAYMKAAREAIKQIDDKIQDLLFDGAPREWAEEELKDWEDDRAADRYDDMMERRRAA